MKATAKVEDPNDVEVTMTFTMPLRSWRALGSQLDSGKMPSLSVLREIQLLTQRITKEVLELSDG